MKHLTLSSLAVLSLLSFSTPSLADTPTEDATGAALVTAHLVAQATQPSVVLGPLATSELPGLEAPAVEQGKVVRLLARALAARDWGLLACALVLGSVYLVRRFLASRVPWLASDVAGVVLSLVAASTLTVVQALETGTPLSVSLVLGALLTAAGASGLYSWGRKLVAPVKVAPASASR